MNDLIKLLGKKVALRVFKAPVKYNRPIRAEMYRRDLNRETKMELSGMEIGSGWNYGMD